MEVLLSSDYCTVSKNMLLITLSRFIFAWIYFPRMLILPYMADGDTFIFADDDILKISWGSVVAVNKINNVYVCYNKRTWGGGGGGGGDGLFCRHYRRSISMNQYNSPLFVIQCFKKQNYFFKNLNLAKKISTKNPLRFILGDRRIIQLSRMC